jgi:lipopolysaccharide transport system permease protein
MNKGSYGNWDLIIEPKKGLWDINLRALWRYRDLIGLFVRRDFVAKYKQTILGPLWFIIQPALTTIMFAIVFSRIAKISTDGLPPILFYMSGTVAWTYFSTCLNSTSNTFITNANIFGKVYFPRLAVPISVVISTLIQFFIQFGLLILIMLFYWFKGTEYHLNVFLLLLPFLIFLMALMGLGFGIVVSSLTTKYRDLTYLVTFGVQLWMYATPIVYPLSSISEKYRFWILLNPLTSVIETFRFALLGSGAFNPFQLLYSTVFAFTIVIIGILLFNRVEKTFIDTV